MVDNDTVLNAQQAAAFLGAHVETIRRMARRGEIPAYKIGKDWRFRRTALLAWLESATDHRKRAEIMVIDDEDSIRRLIRRHLEDAGYRVTTTADPREGLDRIRRHGTDMVLLDLNMPGMNGPMFIQLLRDTHPDLPVTIVTGYPDSDLLMEAFVYGPLMLIPKPIDKHMLLAAVAMTIEGTLMEAGSA